MRFVVGTPDDIAIGQRRLVPIPGVGEVGIFNVAGEYFGIKNVCPHQGGPMCAGRLTGTTRPRFIDGQRPEMEWIRDGEILRCPWHGWEFDIRTGEAVCNSGTRIATYDVRVAGRAEGEMDDDVPPAAETFKVSVEARRLVLDVPDGRGRRTSEPAS